MNASSPEPARSQLRNCPRCGDTGRPVGERTLRAILKPEAAEGIDETVDDWEQQLIAKLREIVPEYTPSKEILAKAEESSPFQIAALRIR